MDEGEGDGADAFDLDYDVAVALDAAHVAAVAGEGAGDDFYGLAGVEVGAVVYLAAGGVGGREEAEELHLGVFDGLYGAAAFVAVNPEGGYGVERVAATFFELEEVGLGVAGKEYARDEWACAGGSVGCACLFDGQIDVGAL